MALLESLNPPLKAQPARGPWLTPVVPPHAWAPHSTVTASLSSDHQNKPWGSKAGSKASPMTSHSSSLNPLIHSFPQRWSLEHTGKLSAATKLKGGGCIRSTLGHLSNLYPRHFTTVPSTSTHETIDLKLNMTNQNRNLLSLHLCSFTHV